MSDSDHSETQSQTSTASLSRTMLECPECGKELQARSMFKHMRLYHSPYVERVSNVFKLEDYDDLIEDAKPFPFDWDITNDFDEKETKSIWGCLGCNSTFTLAHTGNKHCQGKCKKEHIKGLKEYKKLFIKNAELAKKKKEQEKKIPNLSQEKWVAMVGEALLTHKHYHTNLVKLIKKIKELGHDSLFIKREVRICPSQGHWEWHEAEHYNLPTLKLTNEDELPSEYARVCFGIVHMASQLRVLFNGLENQHLSSEYGWDWLDNLLIHPNRNWQEFCDSWLWIHFGKLDSY